MEQFLCGKAERSEPGWWYDETSWTARHRHNSWKAIRRRVFDGLVRTGQPANRLQSFAQCGSLTTVERANLDAGRYRLRTNCCHDRLCTPCAVARSARIQRVLMEQISGDTAPTSFITLTLQSSTQPLSELLDKLYRSFRNLRQHVLWEESVQGGAAFLEIKRNEGRWHPHLHIICKARYIPQGLLSTAWRSITGDSYVVWIERVRDTRKIASYVTKYASKPLNMSLLGDTAFLDESIEALKGRRLCLCFGTWYGTRLAAAEDEELADDEIDAGGWHFVMGGGDLVEQARAGDTWAVNVCHQLGLGYFLPNGDTGPPA